MSFIWDILLDATGMKHNNEIRVSPMRNMGHINEGVCMYSFNMYGHEYVFTKREKKRE